MNKEIKLPAFQMQFLDENTKRRIAVASYHVCLEFVYNQCEFASPVNGGNVKTCKFHSKEKAIEQHAWTNICGCGYSGCK